MCGIAGMIYRDRQRPVERAVLEAMGRTLVHRGPDAEGYFAEPGIGLVHRRLAIIDLTTGNQPIANEDGSVVVVFNGEIYNYQRLRAGLEVHGHRFATQSDTEVLVHLYEDEEEDLVLRLRGMFALALWDRARRRLVLARDRLGLKPLYVYQDAEKLVFGSELKAILACPQVRVRVDPAAVEDYLAWGMIPGERSIFREVRKLAPAHLMVVEADGVAPAPRRYWQLVVHDDDRPSLIQWHEMLQEKITETVQAHQVADVPVGAFLSGGLDSSVVVATQAQSTNARVKSFAIGFREAGFNELPFAREIAERFGLDHVEEVLTPEATGVLDDLVRCYDEPFADSSAVPTMWLARLARRSVKVVLSGDGGDEAFGGYTRYVHDLREARLRRRLPDWFRWAVLRPWSRLWPKADWLPRPLRWKTTLENLSREPAAAYANTVTWCRNPLRRRLLAPDLAAELREYRPEELICRYYAMASADDPLAGMLTADLHVLLPDDYLTKVDRASMACGLEVRPPLVDHELLELAARIPSAYKIHRGHTKWVLRTAYQDQLPPGLVWRRKHGFDVPVDRWLRGPLNELFDAVVLSPHSRVRGLVNQRVVERLFDRHVSHFGRHGHVLWSILVLAAWADRYHVL